MREDWNVSGEDKGGPEGGGPPSMGAIVADVDLGTILLINLAKFPNRTRRMEPTYPSTKC